MFESVQGFIHTASVIIMNIQNTMVQAAVSSAGTVGNVMIIGHLNFFIRCRKINLYPEVVDLEKCCPSIEDPDFCPHPFTHTHAV